MPKLEGRKEPSTFEGTEENQLNLSANPGKEWCELKLKNAGLAKSCSDFGHCSNGIKFHLPGKNVSGFQAKVIK